LTRFVGFVESARGRKKNEPWKCHVFLLAKHNEDFVPLPSEQARLTRNGLGK
jgi:hypothetical protein